jgi:hypothetical protein
MTDKDLLVAQLMALGYSCQGWGLPTARVPAAADQQESQRGQITYH